jgi:hypothetical protein
MNGLGEGGRQGGLQSLSIAVEVEGGDKDRQGHSRYKGEEEQSGEDGAATEHG